MERIEEKNNLNNNLLSIREFDYYSGGLVKNFRKAKYNYEDDEQNDLQDIANWSWNYHYGFGGARESKRMIVSPYPESEKSKLWVYYLRGAGGEEIAMYQGRQTSLTIGQETGKRVYFNLTNFYLEGGNIILRKDGTKEFYFKDHIGSTRVMLASNGGSKVYEYLPFGDTLYCTNHEAPRKGFAGEEFDFESDMVEMGARIYMPKLGRFLAPDPLWEAFPSLTPYHFAYNNPISFHDNSGLAPEKENGDRILGGGNEVGVLLYLSMMLKMDGISEANIASFTNFCSNAEDFITDYYARLGLTDSERNTYDNMRSIGMRPAAALATAIGIELNVNGMVTLTDQVKAEIFSNLKINVSEKVTDPTLVEYKLYDNLFSGRTEISIFDYVFLTRADITISILEDNEFMETMKENGYPNAMGLTTREVNGSYCIRLNAAYLLGQKPIKGGYFINEDYGYVVYCNAQIIAHEFGHVYGWWIFGLDYKGGDNKKNAFTDRENFARWYMNTRYNYNVGIPYELYDEYDENISCWDKFRGLESFKYLNFDSFWKIFKKK